MKDNTFICPICGNPLIKSRRYEKIICRWCKSPVDVPGRKGRKEDRHERVHTDLRRGFWRNLV